VFTRVKLFTPCFDSTHSSSRLSLKIDQAIPCNSYTMRCTSKQQQQANDENKEVLPTTQDPPLNSFGREACPPTCCHHLEIAVEPDMEPPLVDQLPAIPEQDLHSLLQKNGEKNRQCRSINTLPSRPNACRGAASPTPITRGKRKEKDKRTYNTEDSLVVTDPTTSSAVSSLSRGERTGSRAFYCVWSYVIVEGDGQGYMRRCGRRGE
jgi:hypothetical protein